MKIELRNISFFPHTNWAKLHRGENDYILDPIPSNRRDFIADFIQNWLEDNIKPELHENMKKTVENYTNKQEFESNVTSLFESYLTNRADSLESQITKTEE